MENQAFEELRSAVFEEIRGSVRNGPACCRLYKLAAEELRRTETNGCHAAFFYELAFFYLEDSAVRRAYNLWRPVVARLIARSDPQLLGSNVDDTIIGHTNHLFEIMIRAAQNGKLPDFSPGIINSYMKTAMMNVIYERFRKKKRGIVSDLKKRRKSLDDCERMFLADTLLPVIKTERGLEEAIIFRLYIIEQNRVNDMVGEPELEKLLEGKNDPRMALHNRVSTTVWNAYKLLDREHRSGRGDAMLGVILAKWPGNLV